MADQPPEEDFLSTQEMVLQAHEFNDDEPTQDDPEPLPELIPGPAGHQAHLILLYGPNVGQVFRLDEEMTNIGRDRACEVRVSDLGISRKHAAIYRNSEGSYLLKDQGSRNGTFVNDAKVDSGHALANNDRIRLGVNTILKFIDSEAPESNYALTMYEAAMTDGLTGIFNRRYLEVRLGSELAFAQRHGISLAVLILDLDYFKKVNDTWGHLAGDQVLQEFCELLKEVTRVEDTLGRYGGEEFAIICRLLDTERALIMGERIRSATEERVFCEGTHDIKMTVSIGLGAFTGSRFQTTDELWSTADQALYRAKAKGRNQVRAYSEQK